MKKNILSIMAAVAIVGLVSCKKNEAPTIMVHSPTSAGGAFMSGDTAHIHIDFSDDEQLHEVAVTIVREHGDTTFFHAHEHPDSETASLHGDVVLLTPHHSDFTITAVATDHDGETTTNTSSIHCHPM